MLEHPRDHPLELGEPVLEGRLGLDLDLELAAGEQADTPRVNGAERNHDCLARDAKPVEDREDALDLGERDRLERHGSTLPRPDGALPPAPARAARDTRRAPPRRRRARPAP